MKRFLFILPVILFFFPLFSANTLNYQAVVKDAEGKLVANKTISIKFDIVENGRVLYTEEATVTSNSQGFVSYPIGSADESSFVNVPWETPSLKLEVSVDLEGGKNYSNIYSSTIKTVPSAFYAAHSGDREEILAILKDSMEKMQTQLDNLKSGIDIPIDDDIKNSFEVYFKDLQSQIDALRGMYDQFATECQTHIAYLQNRIEDNADDTTKIQNDLNALAGEIKNLVTIEQLKVEIDNLDAKVATYVTAYVDDKNDIVKQYVDNQDETLKKGFDIRMVELADSCKTLIAVELEQMTRRIDQLDNDNRAKFAEFENEIANLSSIHDADKEEIMAILNDRMEKFQFQLDAIKSGLDVPGNEDIMNTLDSYFKELKDNLASVQSQTDLYMAECQQKIADLQTQISANDNDIDKLQTDLTALAAQIKNMITLEQVQRVLNALDVKLTSDFTAQIKEIEQKYVAYIEEKLAENKAYSDNGDATLKSEFDNKINELKTAIDALGNYSDEIAQLTTRMAALDEENKAAITDVRTSIADIRTSVSAIDSENKTAIEKVSVGLSNLETNVQDKLAQMQKELEIVNTSLDELSKEYSGIIGEVKTTIDDNQKQTDAKIQELQAYLNQVEGNVAALTENMNNFVTHEEVNAMVDQVKGTLTPYIAQMATYAAKLESFKASVDKMRTDVDGNKSEIADLKSVINDQQAKIDELTKEIADLKAIVTELRK